MKCPQCSAEMKRWSFAIGHGIEVPSKHCVKCQFNVTDEKILAQAMAKRRELMSKDVRVVAIGDGLGIRFPKSFVAEFAIKKGAKLTLRPGKKGLEVLV